MWSALSEERMGLPFTIAAGPRQHSHSWVWVPYCLRFETPPTWRARSPYLYPPGTGGRSYTPRHWDPFSSHPMNRRATVEVFEPTSTRGELLSDAMTFPVGPCYIALHRLHKSTTSNSSSIDLCAFVTMGACSSCCGNMFTGRWLAIYNFSC
jgi:hypothetical protein